MTAANSLSSPPPPGNGSKLKLPPMWLLIGLPVLAAFVWLSMSYRQALPEGDIRFRFDIGPLAEASTVIQVHAGAAISAFFVGLAILLMPKGRGLHKPLGWTWVGLMAVAAFSSFFIKSVILEGAGGFGPIHALSAWVMVGLPMGVAAIRRKNVRAHRRLMTGLYLGGMCIAGLFTFLPGRLMWSLFYTVQA